LENPWIPFDPHPKQALFLTYVGPDGIAPEEGLFGGAAGGGKSAALLMGAAQYVESPGYAALLLRRTFPDLSRPGALIDMSKQWWDGTAARYAEGKRTWTFPSGATISFGHMEREADKLNYQGSAFHFIGYDEVTQFTETQYTYPISRIRRNMEKAHIPIRARAGANPGGPGHQWVMDRFKTDQAEDPNRVYYLQGDDRFFLPSRIQDNPSLDQETYVKTLMRLDPVTRAQLLEGDWRATGSGANFKREDLIIHTEVPEYVVFDGLCRSWDFAATGPNENTDADYTVGSLVGIDQSEDIWIVDVVAIQGTPGQVATLVRHTAQLDGADIPVVIEQEPGASGKMVIDQYEHRILAGHEVHGVRSTGNKIARAAPLASLSAARKVHIVRGRWTRRMIDEMEQFPYGTHDDFVDSPAGGANFLLSGADFKEADDRMTKLFSRR
jgi:predicted phage terminase large subunit-like protein